MKMGNPKKRKFPLGNWGRNDVKLLCCIVLFIGATVVKFSDNEWIQDVRQVLTRTVTGGAQVSEVVEAFGQSIGPNHSLRDALNSDAVAVFAGKMLGKEQQETQEETQETQEEEEETDEETAQAAGGVSVFLPSETSLPARAEFLSVTKVSSVTSTSIVGIAPVDPVICTSAFGQREHPLDGVVKQHTGMDLAGDMGQEIVAFSSGTVEKAGYNDEYGNYILLSHGYGVETLYAHCSALLKKEGERVEQGDVIAQVGQTGKATGPHVHFEVRVDGICRNPVNYLL